MTEAMSDTLVEEQTEELTFPATLPVLPLKDTVVFPESVTPLAIGQERSIKLVENVVSGDRVLALVTVKSPEAEQPGWDDLYEVGTAAVIHKMIKVPDGTLRILVQGVQRIKLDRQVEDDPYLVGEFVELPDELTETPEVEALRSATSSPRRCASRPTRSSGYSSSPTSKRGCATSRPS
jgi:ATP-dependent Lon protease